MLPYVTRCYVLLQIMTKYIYPYDLRKQRNQLRQEEVGVLLGVTRQTIWRWRKTKGLPSYSPNGINPLFFEDEVLDWVRSQPSLFVKTNMGI